MARLLYNLAKVASSTTGTGTLTLGAAESGFLTFADAGVSNAEVVTYAISDGANSEVGSGTYTASGTTLTRDTVFTSTNSGAKINCSGAQLVFITAVAEDIVTPDGTFTLANKEVEVDYLGAATYTTLNELKDQGVGTGKIAGGTINDAGSGNITVDVGTGFIRSSNSENAKLYFFDWSALGSTAIPSDTARFIGVEYNSGTPQVVVRTTENWNYRDEFSLGIVVNEGGTLYITDNGQNISNGLASTTRRFFETFPIQRDDRNGGLVLGETGTRQLTLTAGAVWTRLTRIDISALDTSVSDTFDRYYRDGAGGWVLEAGQTAWPNTQYDNNDVGGLVTMTNNRYANLWFYLTTNGALIMLYGQTQFTSLTTAQEASAPSIVPLRLQYLGRLIGRLTFEKSAATAEDIQMVWDQVFTGSGTTAHGNLSGLADDDHTQYLLADGTRALAGAWDMGSQALTNVNIDGGTINGITDLAVVDGGTGASTAADARTNLGLIIGTNVQAYDATIVVDADIGVTVQAYDADLTTWAGITPGTGVGTALAVNVGSAGAFVTSGGALGTPSSGTLTNATGLPVAGITDSTVTALGVGSVELGHATDTTIARSSAGNVTIEGNLVYRAGGTDVPVADGGTGASTLTGLLQGNGTSAITGSATINNGNWSGTDLSVANGGTGASTLTGLLQGNGTSAITGSATINDGDWSGTDLSVANGGTGASTLTGLLSGNGTSAITGSATINDGDWSGTDLAVANGGTGSSTASGAFTNLKQNASTTATGVVEEATDAEVRSSTDLKFLHAGHLSSAAAGVALTDAGTVAVNWSNGIYFTLTVAGNRTLGNPTNEVAGQFRYIVIQGNSATDRTLSFGSEYLGELPTLTTIDSGQWYLLTIFCVATSHFTVTSKKCNTP